MCFLRMNGKHCAESIDLFLEKEGRKQAFEKALNSTRTASSKQNWLWNAGVGQRCDELRSGILPSSFFAKSPISVPPDKNLRLAAACLPELPERKGFPLFLGRQEKIQ